MSYVQKSEVYSWRLSPHLKSALEEAARKERKPLSALLEEIAEAWLAQAQASGGDEAQERLRAAALPYIGALDSGRSDRADEAHSEVRSRIARRDSC
jgi:predicted DNA-binding protein